MTLSMSIHNAAQRGYTSAPDSYQRGRPEYPDALNTWLAAVLGVREGVQVVDLGAGTGKFTKLLARAGARVTAIEPVDAMRTKLSEGLPGVRALAGTAEAMPLADGDVDVLICAQAFHWFANEQALREMHRVLRPAGRLGLVWNVRDESHEWVAAITEVITPYEGSAPRFHTGKWKLPFEGQTLFSALQPTLFPHSHVGSFEQVVIDRFLSVSFIAALPQAERESVAEQLRALKDRFAILREPTITFPYVTQAWYAERLAAP
ncbi:class I SAM-dependent methyltransferase [Roseateles sp.]|uniref:class I SAM-dependent methyltransferase n=1 Tax=Roseateles sp. TaxID=1971397 RepID=UPI003264A9F4